MNNSLKQGEDLVVELPILGEGATPIDLSGAIDIRVELVDSANALVAKYSLTTQSGYGTCAVSTEINSNHKILVYVKRGESKTFPIGMLGFAVLVEFPDNAQPDGYRHKEYGFANHLRVAKGLTTAETLP